MVVVVLVFAGVAGFVNDFEGVVSLGGVGGIVDFGGVVLVVLGFADFKGVVVFVVFSLVVKDGTTGQAFLRSYLQLCSVSP